MGEAQQAPSLQYAAKFMCGKATPSDTMPPVAPGTYYTAINVHNPSSRFVILRKKFAVALPFERAGEISRFIEAKLGPDEAMEIDCQEILNIFRRPPFPPIGRRMRFLKGFAVLEPDSAAELDVVAVYTAAGATGQVDALDIERVPGRRVIGGLPDLVPVPDPRKGFCQRDSLGRLVITVKNQGSADAGPSQTTVDFVGVGSVSVPTPAIAAGSSVTLPSVAIPPGCFHPNCNFRIIVDATGLIVESDEGNNVAAGTCIG
jgi:hypothetical protein